MNYNFNITIPISSLLFSWYHHPSFATGNATPGFDRMAGMSLLALSAGETHLRSLGRRTNDDGGVAGWRFPLGWVCGMCGMWDVECGYGMVRQVGMMWYDGWKDLWTMEKYDVVLHVYSICVHLYIYIYVYIHMYKCVSLYIYIYIECVQMRKLTEIYIHIIYIEHVHQSIDVWSLSLSHFRRALTKCIRSLSRNLWFMLGLLKMGDHRVNIGY